jgi:hypothetical protein
VVEHLPSILESLAVSPALKGKEGRKEGGREIRREGDEEGGRVSASK